MIPNRRSILQAALGAAVPAAHGIQKESTFRKACLIGEYPNAQLMAISPNGEWLCFHKGITVKRYHVGGGEPTVVAGQGGSSISLVQFPSLRERWSRVLPDKLSKVSFFAEGDRFLSEVPMWSRRQVLRVTCNVKTLNATDQVIEADPNLITDTYAYAGPGLLLYRYGTIPSNKDLQSIVRTDSGDPKANAIVSSRIDASTGETESIAWLTISADRQSLIHTCGRVLVCRRSRDLSVLWSRELDHSFRIRRTGISATGAFATVGMIEGGRISGRSRRAAVEVFDGRDGSLVRRIDVDGTASVAVSDDGRIVAAGTELERTPRFGRIQTIVRLLDVNTGRELQMLVHTEMSTEKRLESGLRFDGLQFSPDDRYLFSVGKSTRIWKLERGNRVG